MTNIIKAVLISFLLISCSTDSGDEPDTGADTAISEVGDNSQALQCTLPPNWTVAATPGELKAQCEAMVKGECARAFDDWFLAGF